MAVQNGRYPPPKKNDPITPNSPKMLQNSPQTAPNSQIRPSNAFHTRRDAFPTLREPFGDPFRDLPYFPRPWKGRKRPKRAFFIPSKAHFGCFQGFGGLFCLFPGLSDSAKLFLGSPYTPLWLYIKKKRLHALCALKKNVG